MVTDGEDDLPQMTFEKKSTPGIGKLTFDAKTTEAFSRVLQPGKVGDKAHVIEDPGEK